MKGYSKDPWGVKPGRAGLALGATLEGREVAMADIHVKGTPVNALAAYIKRELSAGEWERFTTTLKAEELQIVSGALLASASVPLETVNRVTARAAEAAGRPVAEFARSAGRFGAELGTRTVYRFILMLLSPQSVLRTAPSMWSRVYDGGRLSVEVKEGWARLRVDDFPADPAGCGRITGWFEFIGERAARDLVVEHEPCRTRGGSECAWEFKWPT